MTSAYSHLDIEQLLAEADALIEKINSDVIHDLREEQRLQFEKEAQALKQIRLETQEKLDKAGGAKDGTFGEGMHEAIDAIAKAMKNLGGLLS